MQAATLHVEIMHLASLPPAQPCLIAKPAQVQKEKSSPNSQSLTDDSASLGRKGKRRKKRKKRKKGVTYPA